MRRPVLFFGLAAFSFFSVGQILYPSYYHQEYYDVLRMKNDIIEPIVYRPSLIHEYAHDSTLQWDIWDGKFDLRKKDGDFFEFLDPHVRFAHSSNFPDTYNDGAVWEGKGLNSSLNFGMTGRKGKLYFTFAPVFFYAQNKDFYIASHALPKSEFSYPFEEKIDWVQRYGDGTLTDFHLGQSEIRFIHKKLSLGVSTQSMIFGPAQVNPILMSSNAGGIPRFDIGTSGPVDTRFGKFEIKAFWGYMDESDYFDDDLGNDKRYFTGAVAGLQPKIVPGLSLGLSRVLYREMFDGDFKPIDLFASFWKSIDDPDRANDNYDQMMSLTMRWKFKEYGVDSYIEWARNDFPGTGTDLVENPERTRAVTAGLVKTFDLENGSLLRVVLEHTRLNKIKMSVITTGHPTYYVHGIIENGYTHLGQIMGAYVGPGSNAHHIKIQHYSKQGMIGFDFERVRANDDYFIDNFTGDPALSNDIRFRWRLNYLRFVGNFSIHSNFTLTHQRNWYYEKNNSPINVASSIQIGYRLN